MVDIVEVLQKVYGHLRGDIDLPSFRAWMVGAQLELEANQDSRAHHLVWQMEIFYAEYSDGLADESLWKKSLACLADQERSGTEPFVATLVYDVPQSGNVSFGVASPTSNLFPQSEPYLLTV